MRVASTPICMSITNFCTESARTNGCTTVRFILIGPKKFGAKFYWLSSRCFDTSHLLVIYNGLPLFFEPPITTCRERMPNSTAQTHFWQSCYIQMHKHAYVIGNPPLPFKNNDNKKKKPVDNENWSKQHPLLLDIEQLNLLQSSQEIVLDNHEHNLR